MTGTSDTTTGGAGGRPAASTRRPAGTADHGTAGHGTAAGPESGLPAALTMRVTDGGTAGGHLQPSFADVLGAEWWKLRTLRSTWFALLALLVAGGVFAALFAGAGVRGYLEAAPADRAAFDPFGAVFRANIFVQLFAGYFGLRAATVEFATRTMIGSLAAVPRRGRLLAAKAAVTAALALLAGWATAAVAYLAGAAVLASRDVPGYALDQPGVLRALAGMGLITAMMSLLGLALGVLARTTAGALTAVTVIGILVPSLAPVLPSWLASFVVKYWPTTAGGRLLAVTDDPALLAPVPGLLVFCGYVVVALAIAFAVFRRRDVS
ncbi:ABC transporter permease [Sphaerisporangium rufum]|uniref:ABC transporter permease n=1 Tax=Sphaerisporangium rufum TaxID=1381558 RepID=A0A919UYX7_9ACTN|nr:ABC transporter permease [Sphaerisporangium rufum]GII77219.1 ABC transporter permease [Sphaerisporangium rufum]